MAAIPVLLGLLIGLGAIGLGIKGFGPWGIPLSKEKSLEGNAAKVAGAICFLIGLGLIAVSAWTFLRALRLI